MGADLVLVVPENKKNDRKVVDDYYSFVFSKEKKLRPEIVREKSFTNARYRNALERLEEKGYVLLMERVYSDFGWEWRKAYDVFGGLYEYDKTIIYGDKIKELIKILKRIETELVRSQKRGDPDWTDWEGTMELQVIALCEFALDNNFGIRLSE